MKALKRIVRCTNNGSNKPQRPLMLLFLGFFIALLGIVILTITALLTSGSSTSFGIVIFIGPIPIVVGAGPEAQWLILFAIILAVLSIIMFIAMRKQADKKVS